jgi:hypothetical protein
MASARGGHTVIAPHWLSPERWLYRGNAKATASSTGGSQLGDLPLGADARATCWLRRTGARQFHGDRARNQGIEASGKRPPSAGGPAAGLDDRFHETAHGTG